MYNNNSFAEGYAIGRDSCNNNGYGYGYGYGNSEWWIIAALLFGFGGFGGFGRGFGGFGGSNGCGCYGGYNGAGVMDGYILTSDFANIERKIDGVNNGLCDGFYSINTAFGNLNNTLAQNAAAAQQTMTQGFSGINQGIVTQGYENRIAVNEVGQQLATCCCDLKGAIGDAKTQSIFNTQGLHQSIQANTTQNIMNTNAVQKQISDCC